MALHMMYDRIAPDEPTSEPAMMSIGLFSEKPIPAAAQPEYEFSIDTTTGMSAPPIGMMMSTPSTNAMAVIRTNGSQLCDRKKMTPKPSIAMASSRLTVCWPVNWTGAPWNKRNLYLPESLPKAMTDPENVIAPTNVPMNSSIRLPEGSTVSPAGTMPNAAGSATAATAMHTAARPISECMAATSSGILVISTLRATNAPMPPPTTSPARINPSPEKLPFESLRNSKISATVVSAAIVIPIMPNALPRRAIFGFDRPLSA